MTHLTKYAQRRSAGPITALLAAILLAGCSSGHIGESLAVPAGEGRLCDSVAAADPAVPDRAVPDRAVPDRAVPDRAIPDRAADRQARDRTVLAEPLYRARAGRPPKAPPARGPGQAPETPCGADCGTGFDPFGWLMRLFGAEGREDARSPEGKSPPAEPAAAGLPETSDHAGDDESGDDLRSGEVVARIWIAPFVDANGVYREAAHVRAVLEPAGWRLK